LNTKSITQKDEKGTNSYMGGITHSYPIQNSIRIKKGFNVHKIEEFF
jgi:hypothetical protein